jgi:hypothetical protein
MARSMGPEHRGESSRPAAPARQGDSGGHSAPVADPTAHVLDLQHRAGNRATAEVLRRPQVQRLGWDSAHASVTGAPLYPKLLAKMEGLLPAIGRSRLQGLANLTDGPGQLWSLLGVFKVGLVEDLLRRVALPAVLKVQALGSPVAPTVTGLLKYNVDIAAIFTTKPEATAGDLETSLAAAQLEDKKAKGLIAQNGTEIGMTTAASVSGDKQPGEKTAVAAALKRVDNGGAVRDVHLNLEGNLPGTRGVGNYDEYDVTPPVGVGKPGERRLVIHKTDKFVYYTWNHYGDPRGTVIPCFVRIR